MTRLLWPWRMVSFAVWFFGRIIASNLTVLLDSLTRRNRAEPRVVEFATQTSSAFEISLLAILISLTPGTLVLATQRTTRFTLFVHTMYDDRETTLTTLRELERRMLAAVRPGGAP